MKAADPFAPGGTGFTVTGAALDYLSLQSVNATTGAVLGNWSAINLYVSGLTLAGFDAFTLDVADLYSGRAGEC